MVAVSAGRRVGANGARAAAGQFAYTDHEVGAVLIAKLDSGASSAQGAGPGHRRRRARHHAAAGRPPSPPAVRTGRPGRAVARDWRGAPHGRRRSARACGS